MDEKVRLNNEVGTSNDPVVGGLVDSSESAATGSITNGGIGYIFGSAAAKTRDRELKEKQVSALEKASATNDVRSAYRPRNSNPLTGSIWQLVTLVGDENRTPEFKSVVLLFPTDNRTTTLILWADGRTETYGENYIVVDDVLIFSGTGYITKTKFNVQDKQMVIVAPMMRIVLQEVEMFVSNMVRGQTEEEEAPEHRPVEEHIESTSDPVIIQAITEFEGLIKETEKIIELGQLEIGSRGHITKAIEEATKLIKIAFEKDPIEGGSHEHTTRAIRKATKLLKMHLKKTPMRRQHSYVLSTIPSLE